MEFTVYLPSLSPAPESTKSLPNVKLERFVLPASKTVIIRPSFSTMTGSWNTILSLVGGTSSETVYMPSLWAESKTAIFCPFRNPEKSISVSFSRAMG